MQHNPNPPPARLLPALANEIRQEVEAAEADFQSAVRHAIRAGELLTEVKDQLPHGAWGPWLDANFPGSRTTATNYMRMAENGNAVADLPTVRQAIALLAKPPEERSYLLDDDFEPAIEAPVQEFKGDYAESPEATAARFATPGEGVRMKEAILMYPEAQFELFSTMIKTLRAEWGIDGARNIVFEAVRRCVDGDVR